MTEHISCHCKCKFNSIICNSKQKWNDKTCQCECKSFAKGERDYSLFQVHVFARIVII